MLLDWLFPARCVGCGAFGKTLCQRCLKKTAPIQKDVCPACFCVSPYGMTHQKCKRTTNLDGALAIVKYVGAPRKIIKNTKYGGTYRELVDFLDMLPAHWYCGFCDLINKFPSLVLCPIPLYRSRENQRGFNQSEILMDFFGNKFDLPKVNLLVRAIDTNSQTAQKNRSERKKNVRGAFKASKNIIVPEVVALVDDLFTSASTGNEAAKTLKNIGVKTVFLFTLAHGE